MSDQFETFCNMTIGEDVLPLPVETYKAVITSMLVLVASPITHGDAVKSGKHVANELASLPYTEITFSLGDEVKKVENVTGTAMMSLAQTYANFEGQITWRPGRGGNKGGKKEDENQPTLADLLPKKK